jgi:hypothetical protein
MNERIRELALSKGIFDSLCDPFDELKNGDCYSSVIIDLERFAELIIEDCICVVDGAVYHRLPASSYVDLIREHFAVE